MARVWCMYLFPYLPFRSSIPPKKRQKRDSGSITEPEVAIKDFAKNLKDESDITSHHNVHQHPVITQPPQSSSGTVQLPLPAGLHERHEPKQEPQNMDDDQDETSTSNASMTSKFDESKGDRGTNNSAATPNPFLGMAAASLMDPSAAKGEDFF